MFLFPFLVLCFFLGVLLFLCLERRVGVWEKIVKVETDLGRLPLLSLLTFGGFFHFCQSFWCTADIYGMDIYFYCTRERWEGCCLGCRYKYRVQSIIANAALITTATNDADLG